MNRSHAIALIANRSTPTPALYVGTSIIKSMYQTPGGIQSEMALINSDMLAFDKEIAEYVAKQPGFPHNTTETEKDASELEKFYASVWSPFIQGWMAWYSANNGWWSNLWWNHADDAEKFQAQLIELRAKAKELGMNVLTPEPVKATDPAGSLLDEILTILKTFLYVGIAVGGFVVITTVLRKR